MLHDFSEEKTVEPKLFKATLCQFYLKGPCKNGDKCSYAHGTSELRTPMGGSVADLEASTSEKKSLFKTTLCAKFVTYGKLRDELLKVVKNCYEIGFQEIVHLALLVTTPMG